jgi:CrcB protein
MLNLVAIALGAAIGANLRYGLSTWAAQRLGATWPYGTFIVNVLGCLAIGVLLTLAATRLTLSEPLRLFLVTGLLGGFTTFSTFGYESFTLITRGDWLGAGLYIGGSMIVGLAAVFLGASLARMFGP